MTNKTKNINTNNNKWIVSLVDETVLGSAESVVQRRQQQPKRQIIKLQDPSNHDFRNYVLVKQPQQQQQTTATGTTSLVEIQSLPSDYSSFFIGRHVVGDGNLYAMNRVDPLFWLLAQNNPPIIPSSSSRDTTIKKRSWQPYDQITSSLPDCIQSSLLEEQTQHLFETFCTDQTDNEPYYKFSNSKALRWLERKQDKVYQCLLQQKYQQHKQKQLKKQQQQQQGQTQQGGGGSISSTFNMPEDDPMATRPTTTTTSSNDNNIDDKDKDSQMTIIETESLKISSLQILCSYLTSDWIDAFLESMKLTPEEILLVKHGSSSTKKKMNKTTATVSPVSPDESGGNGESMSSSSTIQTTTTTTPKLTKAIPTPRTAGNKRLAKVNTKGMKTLNSFFGMPSSSSNKKAKLKK